MRTDPETLAKILAASSPPVGVALPVSLDLPRSWSERLFQAKVIEILKFYSWLYYHTADSRRSVGGFPDLVACRERLVYVELKTETGELSADQQRWQEALRRAGEETYVWRPSDLVTIVRVLEEYR